MSDKDQRKNEERKDIFLIKEMDHDEAEKKKTGKVLERFGAIGGSLGNMLAAVAVMEKSPVIGWGAVIFSALLIFIKILDLTIGLDRLTGRTYEAAGIIKRGFRHVLLFLAGYKNILIVCGGVLLVFGGIYMFYPVGRYYREVTEIRMEWR